MGETEYAVVVKHQFLRDHMPLKIKQRFHALHKDSSLLNNMVHVRDSQNGTELRLYALNAVGRPPY